MKANPPSSQEGQQTHLSQRPEEKANAQQEPSQVIHPHPRENTPQQIRRLSHNNSTQTHQKSEHTGQQLDQTH